MKILNSHESLRFEAHLIDLKLGLKYKWLRWDGHVARNGVTSYNLQYKQLVGMRCAKIEE